MSKMGTVTLTVNPLIPKPIEVNCWTPLNLPQSFKKLSSTVFKLLSGHILTVNGHSDLDFELTNPNFNGSLHHLTKAAIEDIAFLLLTLKVSLTFYLTK